MLLEEGERQEEAVPGVEGGGGAQAGRSLPPVPAAGGRQHCLAGGGRGGGVEGLAVPGEGGVQPYSRAVLLTSTSARAPPPSL